MVFCDTPRVLHSVLDYLVAVREKERGGGGGREREENRRVVNRHITIGRSIRKIGQNVKTVYTLCMYIMIS